MTDYTKIIKNIIKNDEQLLPQLLRIANSLYRENGVDKIIFQKYTFNKGDILFTDADYDMYKNKINFVEIPQNSQSRPKIQQKYAFGTLEKVADYEGLEKVKRRLLKNNILEFILTPKYDGIGLRIYDGNLFVTRYDKEFGLDVTPICKNLLTEKQKLQLKNIVLRGELITFEDHEKFASKRNYVSSAINSMSTLPDDIIFAPYEWIDTKDEGNMTYEQMLQNIKRVFGFENIYQKIKLQDLTIEKLKEFKDIIPQKYYIDGVVIRPNSKEYVYEQEQKPSYSIAYKFERVNHVTKFKGIEWSLKLTGFLVPTCIVDLVNIDGINIQKATGNNFNYMYSQNLQPDKNCYISLRTISKIEGIDKQTLSEDQYSKIIKPKNCPICNGDILEEKNSVYRYRCKDFYKNRCWQEMVLQKAKKELGMKGLGEKGILKLINSKDFVFEDWCVDNKITQEQLYLILTPDVTMKSLKQKYSKDKLLQQYKLYNLEFE